MTVIPLDAAHTIRPVGHGLGCWETGPAGFIVSHVRDDGQSCGGMVTVCGQCMPGRKAYWAVDQEAPLTLSPSLLCHCGDHGWVRNGKWVPA